MAETQQEPPGGAGEERSAPSDEELRRRLEEEVRNLRVEDLILQSVVSIVNLTARRIGKDDERDLEQARTGIEVVRALVELLPDEPREQIRNALSELQMLYARTAGGDEEAESTGGEEPGPGAEGPPKGPVQGGRAEPSGPPGGRRPPSKLWTPPGSG